MIKVYKFISTALLVVMIAFVAVMFLPRLVGMQPLAVLSGSMEPTYSVGSLLYVKETNPSDIQVGDPLTFTIGEDKTMVTHRVIEKNEEEQYFRTQGDANENPDGGDVRYSDVVGKPVFALPLLGYLAVYAGTKSGMIIMVTAIVVVLILTFLPDLLSGKAEEKGGSQ